MCAQLSAKDAQRSVTVMGWAQRRRDLGSLIFVWLRDRSGIVQVVFDQSRYPELFEKATAIRSEFVLAIKGIVTPRTPENVNETLKTGEIEVVASEMKILNRAQTPPFAIDDPRGVSDALRLKYRYLDLRRPEMQQALLMRHGLARSARNFLSDQGFLEIETPMLTKSTPEGARDYLVPSRVHPGAFYALPQSPQLFKQLLMVSGCDRYFQIARCFRDEDLRADRQPEFTQIDLEMSFVEEDQVMEITEGMIARAFGEVRGIGINLPLPRMTYKDAMSRYGSDKPDTRFGLEFIDLSACAKGSGFKVFDQAIEAGGSLRGIRVQGGAERFSRKEIDALTEVVRLYKGKGLAWLSLTADGMRSSFAKFVAPEALGRIVEAFGAQAGDILFIVADPDEETGCVALGQLRLEVGRRLKLMDPDAVNLLWVTEFPLLEYSEEEGRFAAKHHPFTSPMEEDLPLLATDPKAVRARAYDIVLNGTELGGGSIRIHTPEIQQQMFALLGFTPQQAEERFGFLLGAFRYGAPPHGGLAIGLDRFAMLMAGCESLRDVIAFPKVQNASCLMTEAPSAVERKQLDELNIAIAKKER